MKKILVLSIFVFLLHSTVPFVYATTTSLSGVYAMMSSDTETPTNLEAVLSLPHLDGITYYVAWRKLQPSLSNSPNFTPIDRVISAAKAHGKTVRIGVYAGRWSPANLQCNNGSGTSACTKCTDPNKSSTFNFTTPDNKVFTSPVPWDPIYLVKFQQFVQQFGQKYDAEPTITYVAITGPSINTGAEATLPLNKAEEISCLTDTFGFTRTIFLNAWKSMIDSYDSAFPHKDLVLALHPWVLTDRNSDISLDIASYAKQRLASRFLLFPHQSRSQSHAIFC